MKKRRINVILKWQINSLARLFYSMMGYNVEVGYDFSNKPHPTEKLMWEMAKESFEYWSKDE